MKNISTYAECACLIDTGIVCQINSEDDIPLALFIEVLDTSKFNKSADEKYPHVFEIGLIPENCTAAHSDVESPSQFDKILDWKFYSGYVNISHILLDLEQRNKRLPTLTTSQATIKTERLTCGTVAAQRGPGNYSYPTFITSEAAMAYAMQLCEQYCSTLSMLVGFLLDRPVNLIGDTGWSVIENQISNEECKE